MPSTTNFGWTTPADTDLVKDGAAAIRTLGNGIDTSFLDLKGGTTGQILSKNSNTDLDFVWAAPTSGDITGVTAGTGISGGGTSGDVTITNSMATAIDAKGDLIVGTGADAFSRLAVGATNGHVLQVDSSTATGLKYGAVASGYSLVSRQTFTSTGTQTFDNVFSSTYEHYQIVLLYGNTTANETADLHMQFRYGATPTTQTQYYNSNYTYQDPTNGAATNSGQLDESNVRISIATGTQYVVHMFISRFSDRLWGGYFATGYSLNGNAQPYGYRGNFHNRFARSGSDAYNGLYFYNTGGSATGSISIYGQAAS